MVLAIVLLNWEQAYQALETIKRLSYWKRLNPLIIVVDNGSSDPDRSLLQNASYGHHLILNSYNRGFAGGNNDGISLAITKGSSKILLLNTDADVTEECVVHLISCMEKKPELGVIGPLLEVEGKIFAGGRDIGLYSDTQVIFNRNKQVSKILPVDYVPGTVFLARTEVFKDTGLLAEDYFFSGEIADFCHKIKKGGYICAICTKCTAIHKTEKSFLRKTLYPYYSLRNRFLYVQRNARYFSALLTGKWVISGMVYSAFAYLRGDRPLSRSLRLAVKDGLTGRFGDQHQRFLAKICEDYTEMK